MPISRPGEGEAHRLVMGKHTYWLFCIIGLFKRNRPNPGDDGVSSANPGLVNDRGVVGEGQTTGSSAGHVAGPRMQE